MSQNLYTFPKNFLWGAAISSHQVEGGNTLNDWWQWEKEQKVKTRSLEACQHYARFESDFDLAKQLSHNAHRFSIEWSRLEPAKRHWNQSEFAHYASVIKSLKDRNIEPVVTLHHFTNPIWFSEMGGWANPRSVDYFCEYTRRCVQAFGKDVTYWVTINEPMVYIYLSFIIGEWPPGDHSSRNALKVLKHLLLAHVRAYKIIHETSKGHATNPPKVGFAQHMLVSTPCRPQSWLDNLSAWLRNEMFNHLFLDALYRGFLFIPGVYCEPLETQRSFDFLGLNYYTRDFLHFSGFGFPEIFGDVCSIKHHEAAGPRNKMGWEIYPKGLFDLLLQLKRYEVPVMITENGICTENDRQRKEFIHRHLIEVARAIDKKVPVMGYLYWSLLDNFEWAYGYEPRFGLIDVNYSNQERQVRESARHYSEICRTNQIDLDHQI